MYRWLVVGMLWFVCLFNYADRQAIFSVFTVLEAEMGLSKVQQGIVGSSFMWVYAAALPFAGLVGDRFNRKWVILGGLLFWSLITVATGLATEYWHLVLFRALEGFGEAFYFPASMSLISDYHGPQTRSRAMALHQSSVYAGTVLGGTAAGYFADVASWRMGFYVFGALGCVLAAVLTLTLREPARQEATERTTSPRPPLRQVFAHPVVLLLIAVFMGANFVAVTFLTWMPTFLKEQYNLSLTWSGLTATFWLQAASVIGVIAGGWLADRWARRFRGGRMLVQGLGLLLGAPLIFVTGWTQQIGVLILAIIGFGFFKGLYDANIWASLYDFVTREHRASALGFMNALGWLGGAPAPILVGYAAGVIGLSGALSATSVIYVVVAALLFAGIGFSRVQAAPRPEG
ncbi:MAG: MFS transporter [Gemmataceae bacterium]|nr:MFS transporter [Gemmataceae bacterium]